VDFVDPSAVQITHDFKPALKSAHVPTSSALADKKDKADFKHPSVSRKRSFLLENRVARWFIFHTKNPNLGIFGGS
jgi:hypothetical protein